MTTGIQRTRSFADIEGVRTAYYRSGGAGPAVVLFHGGAPGACSDLNWFRNFDVLAEAGFDVTAFDQPGFGYSAAPADWTLDFRYRHALAFLRSLEAESFYLIGNSIGGLLCTLLAYRLKNGGGPKIDGLLLAAPFPHFEMAGAARDSYMKHRSRLAGVEATYESVRALCGNTFYDADRATEEIVRLRLSMLQGDNWAAYRKRVETGNGFDRRDIEGRTLDTPALVVWGRNDRSIPPEIGIQAMEHFSNAQFLFLPHCGHWPQTEQASTFNRVMLDFLRGRTAGDDTYTET